MTGGVHQVIAGAAPRDAITNHVLAAREVIWGLGLRSEVFVDEPHIAGELRALVHPHTAWDGVSERGDLAILHYSIDSPAFAHVAERAARSAIHYHNVTPPQFLWRDAPALALQCRDGRQQLASFAGRIGASAADSTFNAREMAAAGLPLGDVIGILRNEAAFPPRSPRAGGQPPRVLFVGRGVPNKCQHDAILSIAAMAQAGHHVELRLAGSWGGNRAYLDRCRRLARTVGVEDRVNMLHSVSNTQLAQEYADADLFLCLSEHEGYCVPLLEAMEAGLPIVAFNAGAVPETLGDAGLLLHDKEPSLVAEAVLAVLDGALADRLADGRRMQSALHSREAVAQRLVTFINGFVQC